MKKILLICSFLVLIEIGVFGQFCNTATFQSNIAPTAVTQTTGVVNSGRPYWTFNAVAGCTYVFSTCGLTTMDTYLRIYATATGGVVLAQNDDAPCGPTGFQSNISWLCPTSGTYSVLLTRYTFATAGCANLNANASLSYALACTSPPVNNGCAPATSITPQLTCQLLTGTTITSTQTFAPSTCSGFTGSAANDVWYSFTTTGTPTITINVYGSVSFDAVLGLYSACNAANLITCVDLTVEGGVETINAGILPAGTYYYRVYSYWGLTGTFSTCVVRNSPLPIELLSFTGDCDEQTGNRKIEWITASEVNNNYFKVERSFDAINWTEVHRQPGAGNSNTVLSYSWIDSEILAEKAMYYRLTQVDFNGQSETFEIVSVSCTSNHPTAIVWPSPNDGGFNVRFSEDVGQNVLLVISNSMGSEVFKQSVQATGSDQIVSFSLSEKLAPGIYYLTIHGKTTQTVKVIVGK